MMSVMMNKMIRMLFSFRASSDYTRFIKQEFFTHERVHDIS